MPSVKDYKSKKSHKSNSVPSRKKQEKSFSEAMTPKSTPRRPGREKVTEPSELPFETDVHVVNVETGEVEAASFESAAAAEATETEIESDNQQSSEDSLSEDSSSKNRVHLDFYGSQILRARFPKVFNNLETVATDWINNGNFKDLEVGHPLADFFAAKGLRRAKDLETQILESPTTEKVAMKVFEVGLKAQGLVEEIKGKLKK
jgi:hypothetical protein